MAMTFATDVEVDSSHNLSIQGLPIYYGTCTSAADAVKAVTCTGFELATNALIFVTFSITNTLAVGSLTMNVNGTGAKAIKKINNGAIGDLRAVGEIQANIPYLFGYNGTYWILLSGVDYYAANSNTYTQAYSDTAAGTAAKVAGMTYYTATANRYVMVNFRYANSAASALTLNINSTGAKPIYINGSASSASNYTLPAGSYLTFYNGTNYYLRTDGKVENLAASSHMHGNINNGGTLQTTDVAIADGDKLVVTDSSDSNKIARTSVAFDGSTATQCLTKKGTWANFTNNAGTVTSVRVQATSPVASSVNTAQSGSLNTTISLSDGYGDTKNPYAAKSPNYVLAGPASGTDNAAPGFRKLVAADIPTITKSKISDFPTSMTPSSHAHGNLTNDGKITATATIASGDKIVIVDSDSTAASKITGSSITFGTSATQCLTNKGTWASFTNNAGTITKVSLNGTSIATSGEASLTNIARGNSSIYYGTCGTAAGTAAKVVTCAAMPTSPAAGTILIVNFTNNNTVASPTLKITSDGSTQLVAAKTIYRYGTTTPSSSAKTSWNAGMVSFVYDGSHWCMVGWLNDDSTVNQKAALANTNANKYPVLHAQNTSTADINNVVYKSGMTYQPSTQNLFIHDKQALYGEYSESAEPSSPVVGQIWLKKKPVVTSTSASNELMRVFITLPTGVTTYTYSNTWITANTDCYATDANSKVSPKTISWAFSAGKVTFTLSAALSSSVTIVFGMLK